MYNVFERDGKDGLLFIYFSPMTSQDIAEYSSWFADSNIQARMYKPDDQWIDYVTNSSAPKAFGAFIDGKMIGHVQVDNGDDGTASIAIAIEPSQIRKGLGAKMLSEFMRSEFLTALTVNAFIEADNVASQKTFRKAGFIQADECPDEDGMIRFSYRFEEIPIAVS